MTNSCFTADVLRTVGRQLSDIEIGESPFSTQVREKGAHWVRPNLVAQIGFTEWTRDGMARHPRFQGLRTDKDARPVVRERR